MAYINGKKVLFSAKVNIEDIEAVEVVKSGYEISQTINDDNTCDLVITDIQDDGTSSLVTVKEKEITENGTYNAREDGAVGYSSVNVNIPDPVLISKTIVENGEYDASTDNADGYSHISINVQSEPPVLVTKDITANGTYNASDDNAVGYSSVNVNLPIYNLTVGVMAGSLEAGSVFTNSQQCLAGQQIILVAELSSSDNTFDGWYQDNTLIAASPIYTGFTMPSKDTTILAKMTKGSTTIK